MYLKTGIGLDQPLLPYPANRAAGQAWRLLHQDAAVMQAVADAHGELMERTQVTAESTVAQFDEDRAFAVTTKNATAAVRASELKAKLCGLLVDRIDQRTAGALRIKNTGSVRFRSQADRLQGTGTGIGVRSQVGKSDKLVVYFSPWNIQIQRFYVET